MSTGIESAILTRMIDHGHMPADLARYVLDLDFTPADHERIDHLQNKVQQGNLTPEEEAELDGYLNVNDFLMVMQSKARRALGDGNAGRDR